MDNQFKLKADFKPAGDQPQAIEKLVAGLNRELSHQVLLGVTGSGKTFTMANVIAAIQRPTLIISHNKTLAAQLYQEFRDCFPENAVEYFVSYYDYYQPEAYVPQRDLYIEKEAEINEEIDKLRLAATAALLTRNDVIVVASVSCIYNLGSPREYQKAMFPLTVGDRGGSGREKTIEGLVRLFYTRSDYDFRRSTFRVRGEAIDVWPSYLNYGHRLQYSGETLVRIEKINPLTGEVTGEAPAVSLFPAKHYVAPASVYEKAFQAIRADLEKRVFELRKMSKEFEAHRLEQRTKYDLEMIKEIGYCSGIENYSRYFDGRMPGDPPFTLLDYFKVDPRQKTERDFLVIIDESHITVPQIRGMYNGDRTRKQTLVDYGFRLPSAIDNRPLKFNEFEARVKQTIYTSATPSEWELEKSRGVVVEQLIRPTGLLDPAIEIRPTKGQIENLLFEIDQRVKRRERVLVTTLTKRMAEDLAEYIAESEKNVKVAYLHSDIKTLERTTILDDLRRGNYDVLVGINLLREGLDLPEVSLVAILDADKEGFLRSETSLIQVMGRAARHVRGQVIMYADKITGSMERALSEVDRRRRVQILWNKKYKITPAGITKPLRERMVEENIEKAADLKVFDNLKEQFNFMPPLEQRHLISEMEREMKDAAEVLDFERAALLRDRIKTFYLDR